MVSRLYFVRTHDVKLSMGCLNRKVSSFGANTCIRRA